MAIHERVSFLLPALVAAFSTACDQPKVACPCDFISGVTVRVPDQPDAQLAAAGGACPEAPVCVLSADSGGCLQYMVQLTQAGTCHVTVTAPDGRQQTADLSAQLTPSGNCCGGSLTFNPAGPLTFTFAPGGQDGSTDG